MFYERTEYSASQRLTGTLLLSMIRNRATAQAYRRSRHAKLYQFNGGYIIPVISP